MKNSKGFTLIEVLTVVAIIGIIAAIAWPSYQDSLVKGNRGAAKAFLVEVVQRQQQFLLDNRAYAANLGELSLTAPPEVSRFYTVNITATAGPPPAFSVRATPLAGQRQVKDGWLEVSNTNARTSQHPNKW